MDMRLSFFFSNKVRVASLQNDHEAFFQETRTGPEVNG